jgi:hypothetical protein
MDIGVTMAITACGSAPGGAEKARLTAAQVAKRLNCTPEDVAVLVTPGKLRPPGKPNHNAVKFVSAVELVTWLDDLDWLDDAMK